MIKRISAESRPYMHDFIDHNGVLCGFDMDRQRSEDFGYAVYDAATREKVADSPAGLPYSFVRGSFRFVDQGTPVMRWDPDSDRAYFDADRGLFERDDVFQVEMAPDRAGGRLVFECYNVHDGFSYHDFSIAEGDTVAEQLLEEDIAGVQNPARRATLAELAEYAAGLFGGVRVFPCWNF